ncbi:MAG: FMN-binding protein [Pirellulales bacterium]
MNEQLQTAKVLPKKEPDVSPPGCHRTWILHALRIALFAAVLWLIRDEHLRHACRDSHNEDTVATVQQVRCFFPRATSVAPPTTPDGVCTVLDASASPIGYVLQTSPASDSIVGYSGPTNTAIALDLRQRIVGIDILSSHDTVEHVRSVLTSPRFLHALDGLQQNDLSRLKEVDAVSGATLTSLAILEGIRARLGGDAVSLRFPVRPALEELRTFFPQARRIERRQRTPRLIEVFDGAGRRIGSALTSSPSADNLIGYQGPTDAMVLFDAAGRVCDAGIRRSYDNEPYVGTIRDDTYFAQRLRGMTLSDLARLDPEKAEIEGVSGATMTSRAIAFGLPMAARAALVQRSDPPGSVPIVSIRDLGTIAVLALAAWFSFSGQSVRRRLRVPFQWLLVLYFGFLNGDMLSQALLIGWVQHGVPWRVAPGLVLLAAAALLVPVVSHRNLYCHHVCPFGAAQHLMRRRWPWRVHLTVRSKRWLQFIPSLLLLFVLAATLRRWPIDLAGIEPFDAFVFWIAGWATTAVACTGILASTAVPMAYCRFGCPTGAVLDYLRLRPHRDGVTRRDLIALLLLGAALAMR